MIDEVKEILKTFNPEKIKMNKVKAVTEFCCPESRTGIILVRYKSREFMINDKGWIYDYKTYANQKIVKWQQYEYDNKGNLLTIKDYIKKHSAKRKDWDCRITQINSDIPIMETDQKGNKVESIYYLNGGLKKRTVKNKEGRFLMDKEYKAGSVVSEKLFDHLGRALCIKRFDTIGNPTTERNFQYDDRGNMVRYTYKAKDGRITTDRKLSYDKDNNLVDDVDIPKDIYDLLPAIDLDKLANEESSESYRHKYYYDCNQLLFEHQVYLAGQFGIAYEYEYQFID